MIAELIFSTRDTLNEVMVQCKDCGYLAVRDCFNEEVCEATDATRKRGAHHSSTGKDTFARVFCFIDMPAFTPVGHDSSHEAAYSMPRTDPVIVKAISREIECDRFVKWIPGRTPKEVEESSFMQALDSRNQTWREDDIRRMKSIEALYEQRHQENLREQRAARRTAYVVASIGFIASILAAAVTAYLTAKQ